MSNGIQQHFKMVDTCAAEFEATTPYYYSCFDGENEAIEDTILRRRYWYLVQVLSVSVRVSNLITAPFTATWAFAQSRL